MPARRFSCSLAATLALLVPASASLAGDGDATGRQLVQFRSVDFTTGIIELTNLGDVDVDLSGWRFCSHDTDEDRRYTAPGALNTVIIEAGSSVFVHYLNDAPSGHPDRFDRSLLGNFAIPLDQDGYGIQLFFPGDNGMVAFNNSDLIADHVQWNIPGEDPGTAGFRTGQSVSVGLWTAADAYAVTEADSEQIELLDLAGNLLHGPANYGPPAPTPCPADLDGNLDVGFGDLLQVLSDFGCVEGCSGDVTGDDMVDFADILGVLSNFGPCPRA